MHEDELGSGLSLDQLNSDEVQEKKIINQKPGREKIQKAHNTENKFQKTVCTGQRSNTGLPRCVCISMVFLDQEYTVQVSFTVSIYKLSSQTKLWCASQAILKQMIWFLLQVYIKRHNLEVHPWIWANHWDLCVQTLLWHLPAALAPVLVPFVFNRLTI